jgi:2-amino-4-hydroxy-6-hydroxymethyldihydropteridine diphosphokinase
MGRQREVFLGLGANLGDRASTLRLALGALASVMVVERVSSVWDTAPQLVTDQPRFLNAAARGRTTLDPFTLLADLQRIERELGRVPGRRYGPRQVDIDLLLFDEWRVDSKELIVPHPGLAERAFALAPLAEIASDVRHPVVGWKLSDMLAHLEHADIHRDDSIRL